MASKHGDDTKVESSDEPVEKEVAAERISKQRRRYQQINPSRMAAENVKLAGGRGVYRNCRGCRKIAGVGEAISWLSR